MSIEERLKSLEEAVRENTAALLGKSSAKKSDKADKDDDAEEKPRSRRSSKDDDAEEKPRSRRSSKDDDAEEKPRSRRSSKDDDERPSKGKMTIDDVRKAYAEYLGPKDGKNYDAHADFVDAVLNEVGADTVRDIKPADFPKVMHWLELKKDGQKKIDFDNDLPEEDEDRPRRRNRDDD